MTLSSNIVAPRIALMRFMVAVLSMVCTGLVSADGEATTSARQDITGSRTLAQNSCLQLASGELPGWYFILAPAHADQPLWHRSGPNALVQVPLPVRGNQTGTRYLWLHESHAVDWRVARIETALAGVQITTYQARDESAAERAQHHSDGSVTSDADVAALIDDPAEWKPETQWVFDGQCRLRDHRRLIRHGDIDQAVISFSPSDEARVTGLALMNPNVPRRKRSASIADAETEVRVALVDSGVNYRLPEIRDRLARDAEGRLIGFDFWELDARPFDAHPAPSPFRLARHGTRTASILLREAPHVRLVPYRYPRPDMTRMRDLVEHADANGVRIMGLPLGGNRQEDWQTFFEVASDFPHMLFIASAGNNGRDIDEKPVYPASMPLLNMLVVTSSDDFVRPAAGVNWGRGNVDYLLPAEEQWVLDFSGNEVRASGSSYAVPRLAAAVAHLQRRHPEWQASDFIAELARRFATGTQVRHVGKGYIGDPVSLAWDEEASASTPIRVLTTRQWLPDRPADKASMSLTATELPVLDVPVEVFVIEPAWTAERVNAALLAADNTLRQCGLRLSDVRVSRVQVPAYLRDLETGRAHSVMSALRSTGSRRRAAVVFARDTAMLDPFDAEAFGRGNTRNRPWLQDSVWLTDRIEHGGLALAHELFHVLANSGAHVSAAGNLMQARTNIANTQLLPGQCLAAREQAVANDLASNTP